MIFFFKSGVNGCRRKHDDESLSSSSSASTLLVRLETRRPPLPPPFLPRHLFFPSSFSRSRPRFRIFSDNFDGPPKIAFLFLARRNLPFDYLWGRFFENADVANFSFYIHSAPGFVFDASTWRSHFFYDRQCTNSIEVVWGESSMIEAEELRLATALEDQANQRFVLLSDIVSLYITAATYMDLMASSRSFVDSGFL